jgi:hypothetical protein
LKQDAQYALLLESIAEINARLRILDEANARLEAAVERQLELLEILTARHEQMLTLLQGQIVDVPIQSLGRQTQEAQQKSPGSRSQAAGVQANRIVDSDHEYARDTHPALFKVVDLLEQDERARRLSVRQLAQETGVSKSWCAIARRYVLRGESVH